MSPSRWIVMVVCIVATLVLAAPVAAVAPKTLVAAGKPGGKVSARLAMLSRTPSLRAASAVDQARALSVAPEGAGSLLRDTRGRVLAEVRTRDLSPAYQQQLTDAGAVITHVSERYSQITAYLDPAGLSSIEALPATVYVVEALAPVVSHAGGAPVSTCPQGSAVSEGDTQLRAALARTNYTLTGAGVKVGVLSDSYNALGGAAADVTSGDLPGSTNTCGHITPVAVLSDTTGTSDEGRGMAQIVHDMAPAATLSFATAWLGLTSFADNIRALRAAGADILVDDVYYFAEPFFQDGPVAVAISDTVGGGALYFTSAGNQNIIDGSGRNVASNEAPAYRPVACRSGVPTTPAGDCHDFDPGGGIQNSLDITLPNGNDVTVILQWAEPWYGVVTDFDVYLTDDVGNVLSYGALDNTSQQVPYEYMYYTNLSGASQNLHISVARWSGSTPRLKVVLLSSGITAVSPAVSSGSDIVGPTLIGHSASPFAFSVAAARYNNDNAPEYFSSRGPAAHYFGPVVGTSPAAAITPEVLQQPDFAATDGGCTTFFGQYGSGCYRFYGTSAAAPHAAGIAALLKQKANALGQPLTRSVAKLVLQSSARAMSSGNVNSVGAGLLDANAAVNVLNNRKSAVLPMIRR